MCVCVEGEWSRRRGRREGSGQGGRERGRARGKERERQVRGVVGLVGGYVYSSTRGICCHQDLVVSVTGLDFSPRCDKYLKYRFEQRLLLVPKYPVSRN